MSSSAAWACPDLAGNYICRTPNGNEPLTVSQSVRTQSGQAVTVYMIDGQPYQADGQLYPINEKDLDGKFSSQCVGDALVVHAAGNLTNAGQVYGSFDVSRSATKDAQGQLVSVTTGSAVISGQTYPANGTVICAPAN